MDESRRKELFRHFEKLCNSDSTEQDAEIGRIAEQDPSMARELRAVLSADKSLESKSFLEFSRAVDAMTQTFQSSGVSRRNSPTETEPLIPGYEIIEVISRGGQGTVYLAIQSRTEQQVAIKFISLDDAVLSHGSSLENTLQNVESEIKTASTLRHPNTIRLYDAGPCEGGFFLVMELVHGQSLDLVRTTINQFQVARIVKSIAEAVSEAHQQGILHLDIKPKNILYDQSLQQPRLIDFGLARLESIGKEPGLIAGTPGFMAPEQITGGALDQRTDVFGLGATLYYLLTGSRPVEGEDSTEIIRNTIEREVPSARIIDSKIDEKLDQICSKSLQKSPEDRYQTMTELANELARVGSREGARSSARMANGIVVFSLSFMAIHFLVALLLRFEQSEWMIWPLMFAPYLPLFIVFGFFPPYDEDPNGESQETIWSIWLGKLITEVSICFVLRLITNDPYQAILIAHPVILSITGMAVVCGAPRFWKGFYLMALVVWALVPIQVALMLFFHIAFGPLVYSLAGLGSLAFALHLRNMADKLRSQNEIQIGNDD